jgi:osmotically-inducible protein OsmY
MINKQRWLPTALLLGAIFTGMGVTAFATDNPQAGGGTVEPPDSSVNERVETLLRTDIGLAGSQFRVQTRTGVVTLAGSVPDEYALRRALDLASGVRGVREVRNSMVVDVPK